MEEYPINLMNCFVVIWKRKILIMLGTLVCLVAVGVVSLRLTETYRAESLMRVGKTIRLFDTKFSSIDISSFTPIDDIRSMVESIPMKYGIKNEKEAQMDSLKVEGVNGTSMLKVIWEDSDRKRVREMLKSVIYRILADHHRMTEASVQPYKTYIGNAERNIKEIQKDRDRWEVVLEEINTKMNIEEPDYGTSMMAQSQSEKIVILQAKLGESRNYMEKLRQEIPICRSLIYNISQYKTKVIGDVKETTVRPDRKRNVLLAGIVGLIMSLFLALFFEFLGKVTDVEKKKKESNSVIG